MAFFFQTNTVYRSYVKNGPGSSALSLQWAGVSVQQSKICQRKCIHPKNAHLTVPGGE